MAFCTRWNALDVKGRMRQFVPKRESGDDQSDVLGTMIVARIRWLIVLHTELLSRDSVIQIRNCPEQKTQWPSLLRGDKRA